MKLEGNVYLREAKQAQLLVPAVTVIGDIVKPEGEDCRSTLGLPPKNQLGQERAAVYVRRNARGCRPSTPPA